MTDYTIAELYGEMCINRVSFSYVHDGGTFQFEGDFAEVVHTVGLPKYKKLIALLFKSDYRKENQRAIRCISKWMEAEYDRLNEKVGEAHIYVIENRIDPAKSFLASSYIKRENEKLEKVEAKAKKEFAQFEKRYMLFFEKTKLGGY